ncbi:MAG: hypothetical protein M3Q95_05020 [Bacteroidota bacterium]|nr:hypothetical protein [Bacteroidota bacterium]
MRNPRVNPSYFTGLVLALAWMVVVLLPYGCSQSPFDGLKEGKVIYDVTFETADMNPMMKAMLPSEVVTYFRDNKTCTVISMGMNMMETRLISDAKSYQYITLISAMGRKVAMVLDRKQVEKNFVDRVNLQVRHTSETKDIAGVTCRQAIITDSTNHTYPVYYTREIAVNDPNWSSPFKEIEGLLMEYSISLGGMVMSLKAKEIINTQNEQSFFEIPEGYEIIKDPSEFKFNL